MKHKDDAEIFTKPGFDMRLEFNKHLRSHLDAIALYCFNNNISGQLDVIGNYMALTKGFIDPKKYSSDDPKKGLRNRYDLLVREQDKLLNLPSSTRVNRAVLLQKFKVNIMDFKEELFVLTKHLLLPTKEEDDMDFDDKSFISESER